MMGVVNGAFELVTKGLRMNGAKDIREEVTPSSPIHLRFSQSLCAFLVTEEKTLFERYPV